MKISSLLGNIRLVAAAVLLAGSHGLSASTLVHSFLFNNSFADSTGAATMTANGGSLAATQYVFGANQGLTLTGATNSLSDYSIEMEFSLATVSGFNKILDFQNLTSDRGLYVNGGLIFFDLGSGGTITASTQVRVVLTRESATNTLVGYVNGTQAFSLADPLGRAVFTAPFQFFRDDNGGTEASAGSVDLIRVYDGALTATEVANLTSPGSGGGGSEVPEPATVTLTALALAAVALTKRRA